jgi:type II secretory pathway pseudopilin PulG
MELIVVVIIIGILATLGYTHYGTYQEKTLDREAQANLLLILAAERIARLESNDNLYPGHGGNNTNTGINTLLKMTLPTTNPKWNYTLSNRNASANFCAQAARNWTRTAKYFSIYSPNSTIPDPQPQSGQCR